MCQTGASQAVVAAAEGPFDCPDGGGWVRSPNGARVVEAGESSGNGGDREVFLLERGDLTAVSVEEPLVRLSDPLRETNQSRDGPVERTPFLAPVVKPEPADRVSGMDEATVLPSAGPEPQGVCRTPAIDRRHPLGPQGRRVTEHRRGARPDRRHTALLHVQVGEVEADLRRTEARVVGYGGGQDSVVLHDPLGRAAPPNRAVDLIQLPLNAKPDRNAFNT